MSSTYDSIRNKTIAMLDGFQSGDSAAIFASWADDCVHYTLPKSLRREKRTKEQFKKYIEQIRPFFSDVERDIDNVIIDTTAKKSAVHAFTTLKTPVGVFQGETTFFTTFDDAGDKVVKVEEFVDSGATQDFFPKLRNYIAKELEKKQGNS